jgi:hypothetical protein
MQIDQAQPKGGSQMEEQKPIETPQPVQPPVEPAKEPDLVTRVSQFKNVEEAKQDIDGKFNINDLDTEIEKLPNPNLKEKVLGLKKSLLRGENLKYQEIATLRKQYETALAEQTNWSPERIQAAMKDPNFIQAAQTVISSQNTESDSMLTEKERKLLEDNNQRVNQLLQAQQQQIAQQQHQMLKQKYANYDPEVVEKVVKDLQAGKAQINYEHIWRALDYEPGIQRAYDMAKQDKVVLNEDRAKAMSFDTNLNLAQPSTVEKQKGESNQSFILRSYQEHTKKK